MRKTDEQKKAAYQQRIAALREMVRRTERQEVSQERRDRAPVGIVLGRALIEHALSNPNSEVRRLAIHLIEDHLHERPDDRPVAELLERLSTASGITAASEAAE